MYIFKHLLELYKCLFIEDLLAKLKKKFVKNRTWMRYSLDILFPEGPNKY